MTTPDLPLEIIEGILAYLSPRELSSVTTLCKYWNKYVTRLLYRSVNIYTLAQYNQFIRGLQNCDSRITSNREKTGYQVRCLFLHTCDILLDSSQVKALKKLCPMITVFDYGPSVPITDEHLCYFIPGWKHLTRLPSWHEDKHKKWIPKLSGQLTYLYCFIEELAFLPSFIKTTPLFPNLVTLKLSLSYVGPPIGVSWMEMLNDQCPVLESLDMEFTGYDVGGGLKGDWKPAEKLRTLAWRIDAIIDPIWYTYLSQKYPNVRELELQLGVDDYFDGFPAPYDQELNERMCVIHRECIVNLVTNFQQLWSFKILLETKQPSYLRWYSLPELASWLGTPAAKNITNLYWRTDPYQSGLVGSRSYGFEDDESGPGLVDVEQLNPLGNIKVLKELAYDIHYQLPECVTNICAGTLVLENLASLELFFSRNYNNMETWEHLDMNVILDGCPHLKTLGLAGVNSSLEGGTLAFQQNQQQRQLRSRHWKLIHFRLHHVIINDDDYLSNILNRCPNINKLKLYDCRIYQRRILHRQQPQSVLPEENERLISKSYTIDIPGHFLSLVDIRALRLVNFGNAPDGDIFDTLEITQQNGRTTFSKNQGRSSDTGCFLAKINSRYADRVIFDMNAILGDSLYHEY